MANSIHSALSHHDSIRVVQLHAGSFDSELRGELHEVRLGDQPSYEALSYVWGHAPSNETFSIASKQTGIPITPSLALALRYFRLEVASRTLWVDAICIDQDERNPEKGHQVGLMDKIYASAKCVLIWLGCANNTTPAIFEYLRVMAAAADRFLPDDIEEWWIEDSYALDLNETDLEEIRNLAQLGWRIGVAEILGHPWFERLWVVQEVSLAQRAMVFCGTHGIPWKHLGRAVYLLREAACRWPVNKAAAEPIERVCSLVRVRGQFLGRQQEQHVSQKPFRTSIRIFDFMRDRKCTDDRDRVYALMTLVEPQESLSLKPDYRLSVNQTYKMFAKAVLQRHGIIILSYAGLCCRPYTELPPTDKDYLPSWAPDFRKAQTTEIELPLHKGASSAFIKHAQIPEVRLSSNENIVEVLGFLLDEVMICEAVPVYRGYNGVKEMRSLILQFEQIYHKFSRKGLFKPDNKDRTFAQTLVGWNDADDAERGWEAYRHQIINNYMAWAHTDTSTEYNTKKNLLSIGNESEITLALEFHRRMCKTIGGLKLFLTKHGFLGVGPSLVEQWDIFAPISTDTRPYIIRRTLMVTPSGGDTVFQLIGECHVVPFGLLVGIAAMMYRFLWTWIPLI